MGEGIYQCLMYCKIISWNVRGFNDPYKRDISKTSFREWATNVIFILKKKCLGGKRHGRKLECFEVYKGEFLLGL